MSGAQGGGPAAPGITATWNDLMTVMRQSHEEAQRQLAESTRAQAREFFEVQKAQSEMHVAMLKEVLTGIRPTTPNSGGEGPSSGLSGVVLPDSSLAPAIKKLQERDPEFPTYDGNPENFLPWLWRRNAALAGCPMQWQSPLQ